MKNKSPFSLGAISAIVLIFVVVVPMLLTSWAGALVDNAARERAAAIEAQAELVTSQAIARQMDAATGAVMADTRAAHSPLVMYSGTIVASAVAISGVVVATCAAIVVVMARRLRRLEATLTKVAQSGAASGDSGALVVESGKKWIKHSDGTILFDGGTGG